MPPLLKSVSQKLRMAGRDYSRRGWVFVTLSADYHRHLFGEVEDDAAIMACNELGRLVADEWARISTYFSGVKLGASQVMPNHFHGLIWLSGFQTAAKADQSAADPVKIVSLGDIINPFKGGVTRKWRRCLSLKRESTTGASTSTAADVSCLSKISVNVWQPNYWDVICFNDEDLAAKEAYIQANPLRWALKRVPRGIIQEGRYLGNLSLLTAASKRALRISRRATPDDIEKTLAEARNNQAGDDTVLVSTFFSPGERTALDRLLLSNNVRLIWLLPMGLPKTIPIKWGQALADGRALWLSAFPDEATDATRAACEHCNAWAQRLEEGTC